jgi:hypothetical protein
MQLIKIYPVQTSTQRSGPVEAAFCGDRQARRKGVQSSGNDLFTHAGTVGVGGVDEIDSQFNCPPQDADGLAAIRGLAPNSFTRDPHRAESQPRDGQIVSNKEFAGSRSALPHTMFSKPASRGATAYAPVSKTIRKRASPRIMRASAPSTDRDPKTSAVGDTSIGPSAPTPTTINRPRDVGMTDTASLDPYTDFPRWRLGNCAFDQFELAWFRDLHGAIGFFVHEFTVHLPNVSPSALRWTKP